MKKTVFLYSGEGTHSGDTQARLLKQTTSWPHMERLLGSMLNIDLERMWQEEIGRHRCPYSPLLTTISQICLSEIWSRWGYRPDVVIGHSTGEIAASYQAGLYTMEEVLQIAYRIGEIGSQLQGVMLHGKMNDAQIADLPVNLSSYNFSIDGAKHVTLSGYEGEMKAFLQHYPAFTEMKLPHPWHHPDYGRFADRMIAIPSRKIEERHFISGLTAGFETTLNDHHWREWLVKPIDFIKSMQTLQELYGAYDLEIIEIGFHPVLEQCCKIFDNYTHVSSMFRGEDDINWIMFQRKKLDQNPLLEKLRASVQHFQPRLDFSTSLAYQGLGSLELTQLSLDLLPLFPGLAPQDFYRYKTINQLIAEYGIEIPVELSVSRSLHPNKVVIAGMSCRLPSAVETPAQFWESLITGTDQIALEAGRGGSAAGFLSDTVSRFDHRYFHIALAEARTMDPQQILALELTEMLWKDAGIDPENLDRRRVGVYLGVWNQEYQGDRTSVYHPTGTNPSIIAARISYHYDLRGPSWVSNTACSSSLVAVHYAAKDIEAGRIDYAIAGGVNMLLDEGFTANMRKAGFLSSDNRCKTFDDSADGYVRAEGGGLVLLANKSLVDSYYGEVSGSSVNQNGRRSQIITAPHAEAQEELILTACQEAGIKPQDISYLECHGTGTKIGDPIEIAAIRNTVAKNRKDPCHIGSVKSNIGHLESAAGIAGLIKSIAALNFGTIPANLHFQRPNTYIDFASSQIHVVTRPTSIDHQAYVGVSSFGFGGTNAHIIVKGVEAALRKAIQPQAIPFDRKLAAPLAPYLRLLSSEDATPPTETATRQDNPNVRDHIRAVFYNLTGIEEIDANLELLEQGLDSMSATELVNQLEAHYKIDIGPEIFFEYPLFDQFAAEIENRLAHQKPDTKGAMVTREAIDRLVGDLFFQLTSIPDIDPAIELTDQGLDSMSGTELISQLEKALNVDIGPDLLFDFPLRAQLVDELVLRTGAELN